MEPKRQPKLDAGEVTGEHPDVDQLDFARAAREHFKNGAEKMKSLTPESHEVTVQIGDQVVPASELKIRLKKTGEFVIKHKEITIVVSALTVAGLLAAHRALRTHKK